MEVTSPQTQAGEAKRPRGRVEAGRVRVWEDPFRVLHASVDGEVWADVRAVRVFPVSGKAGYISLLDTAGREVAMVADPEHLDAASRQAVATAIGRMYYVPRILRVDEITETWGVSHWRVQTDRGYASFEVVDREYIRKLPRGRFVIQDADGNRFEIEDLSRLDARSQALVQSET